VFDFRFDRELASRNLKRFHAASLSVLVLILILILSTPRRIGDQEKNQLTLILVVRHTYPIRQSISHRERKKGLRVRLRVRLRLRLELRLELRILVRC
jgi:hypothetical protein